MYCGGKDPYGIQCDRQHQVPNRKFGIRGALAIGRVSHEPNPYVCVKTCDFSTITGHQSKSKCGAGPNPRRINDHTNTDFVRTYVGTYVPTAPKTHKRSRADACTNASSQKHNNRHTKLRTYAIYAAAFGKTRRDDRWARAGDKDKQSHTLWCAYARQKTNQCSDHDGSAVAGRPDLQPHFVVELFEGRRISRGCSSRPLRAFLVEVGLALVMVFQVPDS